MTSTMNSERILDNRVWNELHIGCSLVLITLKAIRRLNLFYFIFNRLQELALLHYLGLLIEG
jgi:hypothetical protein